MGGAGPWDGECGDLRRGRAERWGSAGGARQPELRANLDLAASTPCVTAAKQVQVHCLFLFLQLKASASCTTVLLCQKEQPSSGSSPLSL